LRINKHGEVWPPEELGDVSCVRAHTRTVKNSGLRPTKTNGVSGIYVLLVWELGGALRRANHPIVQGYIPPRKCYSEEARLEMSRREVLAPLLLNESAVVLNDLQHLQYYDWCPGSQNARS
jgi:hypothetical protein